MIWCIVLFVVVCCVLVRCWLFVVGCWSLGVRCVLFVVVLCCLLCVACNVPCSLFVICCLLCGCGFCCLLCVPLFVFGVVRELLFVGVCCLLFRLC